MLFSQDVTGLEDSTTELQNHSDPASVEQTVSFETRREDEIVMDMTEEESNEHCSPNRPLTSTRITG